MQSVIDIARDVLTEEVEKIDEAVDVKKVIADLINSNWAGSNEDQMKAVQLLKGVALSDEEVSNKFMKALDKFTSGLKAEDFS